MNAKLGGYLVGYGLKKRNGEEKRVIFDKPIHNTITKHCLNNLLTFDGTNAQPGTNFKSNYESLFVKSNSSSERYGVFNSCCLGDGTGETSVNDTDLKHRVSEQTTTKKTGSGWCGTTVIYSDATIKLRVSHIHNINSNFTVKEIGWYNAILGGGILNYTLSSRVQLDNFVDVESGDEFYSIYEITVQFQDIERYNDFFGYGPGYSVNAGISDYQNNASFWQKSCIEIPYIDESGYGILVQNGQYSRGIPSCRAPWVFPYSIGTFISEIYTMYEVLHSDWNKSKPFLQGSFVWQHVVNYNSIIFNVKNYNNDSFYRDMEITIPENKLGSGIYGIIINGTFYRFGTFDEQDNFTPTPITINSALKITVRQSWSTDLLTPTP